MQNKTKNTLTASLITFCLFLVTPIFAAPGELDPGFGLGGKVITDLGGWEYASDVMIQPDGKIIVAGTFLETIGKADFLVIRYNTDGTLDTSFGLGGKVSTDFGGADEAGCLALQADGKIVVAGGSNGNFAMARYNSDGSLDLNFGLDGKVTTDFSGLPDSVAAILLQPDGKIILGGTVDVSYVNGNLLDAQTDADFGLVRYETNGSLDTTFGTNGKVATDFNGRYDSMADIGLQADGKIVAAGFAATPAGTSNWDLWDNGMARYNSDGILDPTFGFGGKVISDWSFSGENGINALIVQPDGSLFTAGYACHYDPCYKAVARYYGNGNLEYQEISAFLEQGNVTDLSLQADGKIIGAGMGLDFGLERYNSVGSLDTTFGTGGKIYTDFGAWDYVKAIAVQPNGRIVAAGTTQNGHSGPVDIALARYLGDTAQAVPPVLISGRVLTPGGLGLRNGVVTLTDSAGNRRSAITSTLGFYSFADIPVGETVTISVSSRRYRFQPVTRAMNESLSDVDLVALE